MMVAISARTWPSSSGEGDGTWPGRHAVQSVTVKPPGRSAPRQNPSSRATGEAAGRPCRLASSVGRVVVVTAAVEVVIGWPPPSPSPEVAESDGAVGSGRVKYATV